MTPQPRSGSPGDIIVKGARLHNLKNLTVAIPQYSLTVVTGVSGSGKSSLAFDTIYAEGQRRYIESLSAYARQFLERMEKPAVDEIDGIAPAIAIRQKNTTRNPRSTVATSTEIWDYMRLLWARAGRTYCPVCGRQVQRDTVDQVAQSMLAQPASTRFLVLFPVKHDDAQIPKDRLNELRARGFNRLWQSGTTFEFSTPESLLGIDWTQPVHILADRIAIKSDLHQRLVDTVETCYRESGEVIFLNAATQERILFSERFHCKYDNIEFAPPEPILFSFNSPAGACPRCQGFGNTIDYSLDLVVPNRGLSINDGAIEPWTKPSGEEWIEAFRKKAAGRVRFDMPFCDLSETEQHLILEGDRKTKLDGIRQYFNYLETKKYKVHVRVLLSRYRGYTRCPDCHGSRLRKEALNVKVETLTIADVARLNIAQAAHFFSSLVLSPEEAGIAGKILTEIAQRLKFLNDVGLEYLTLDRLSATLSGGEAQRIQLATCLGSRLVGACYVLDEPSIGLHSRDTERLVNILTELRDIGNTILVVEHDPEVMKAADHIIDLGPGAGEFGGTVVFEGDYPSLIAPSNASLTGRYLRGELKVSHRKYRRRITPKGSMKFFGARMHNLKGIDVSIPLGLLTVVTGVSGSGKSTLVHDVIYKSLQAKLNSTGQAEGTLGSDEASLDNEDSPRMTCTRVEGASRINDVVMIDQTPIGRTPRSNPVTYIKAFDAIRNIFAATRDAEKRGYAAGHFSFNVPGGRCETCQGDGTVTVEMQFLADVELVCDDCKGTRFKSAILDIRYKGLNVHEVLQLSVTEAIKFFHDTPRLAAKLQLLEEAGLGYLRLGQSATTLSGGEAQRVKLAAHLAQATNEGTLFICDEPTTGLHFDDISRLLTVFERLIDHGGTLLVIEHNAEVIRAADWVIDLGPEGGEAGGRIVAEGTPEDIASAEGSHTARFLRESSSLYNQTGPEPV